MYSAVRTMNKKIVVIGGGAAGMMAALSAAEQGAQVTLLEPNERLGKKLNITGKGRCNVTNNTDIEGLLLPAEIRRRPGRGGHDHPLQRHAVCHAAPAGHRPGGSAPHYY